MPTGQSAAHTDTDRVRTKHRNNKQTKTRIQTSPPPQPDKQNTHTSVQDISRLREVIGQLQGEGCGHEREEELRWKINQLERDKLELTSKYNQEVSGFESQLARLRALIERGEAHRQTLEYEVVVTRRDATAQITSSEEKVTNLIKHNQQLKGVSAELSQRVCDLETALQISRQAREEDQQGLQAELHERDCLLLSTNTERDFLQTEKSRLETLLQEQNDTLQGLKEKMDRVQTERERDVEELRVKKSELKQSEHREERLKKEVESAMQRVKALEENVESERAAHLEAKFNSDIIQLRLRDIEAALCVEKSSQAESVSKLEQLTQQLRELERSYTHERDRANNTHLRLTQLEKEHLSTKTDLTEQLENEKAASAELIGRLEQEKAESAKLSLRLLEQEGLHTENQHTLSLVQQKLRCVEEAHEALLKEMEQLLQHYHQLGAPQITSTGVGERQSALMDILRRTLHHYHTELKDLLKLVDTLNKENKDKEKIITEQRRNIQECEDRCVCLGEEVECLRVRVSDAAAAADRAKVELHRLTQLCEEEREKHTHTRAHIHTLTQEHQRDQQEKLAFLHSLYQQLVAGCVLVSPPQSMLGSFLWAELKALLQEQVDALTSDLSSANQKISALESVCEGKTAALESVCEQLKQREESWIRQRRELDTQHTELTSVLHSRVQAMRRQLDQSEECVRVCDRARCDLEQEVTRLQDQLSVCAGAEASLLAACALLCGCVCELHARVCELSAQKAVLRARVCEGEALEREVRSLLHALSEGTAQHSTGVWMFRRSVIAVLAALRLQKLSRSSHTLLRLSAGVCVREVRLREREEDEEEEERSVRVMKMMRSSELSVLIHSCMQGAHLDHTECSSAVLNAVQISFSKLLERLLCGTHLACWGRCAHLDSLAQRLGHGLQRLRRIHNTLPDHNTSKCMVSSLQQHFLVFTQRLHSAEVERRELRLQLSRLSRKTTHTRNKTNNNNTHTTCVPGSQFDSVCVELRSALHREQQAQTLLHQQATQLQELGLSMELHTGDQLEKDHTLAQAVQSLSEAKAELKRKDQSLRLLGKRLSQSQHEKQQLQQSITSAENALCTAAKNKESLSNYMKSVENCLTELKDRLILSRSSREDFTLNLPTILLDTGGQDMSACQTLVGSFVEVYQLTCSKMASLEREISSYQSHITSLKTELQDACLRETHTYIPVMGSHDPAVSLFGAEVHCGTAVEDSLGDMCPLQSKAQSVSLKKSKAVKKAPKNTKTLTSALKP